MNGIGTFDTLAEIAIAITGFSGVVAVLGRRGAPWSPGDLLNLKALIFWSLGVVFLALVPGFFALVDYQGAHQWRISHAILALFHITHFVWFTRNVRALPTEERHAVPLFSNRGIGGVALLICLSELAVVAGFLGGIAPALYLVALSWFLFIALLCFVALFLPQPEIHRGDASDEAGR